MQHTAHGHIHRFAHAEDAACAARAYVPVCVLRRSACGACEHWCVAAQPPSCAARGGASAVARTTHVGSANPPSRVRRRVPSMALSSFTVEAIHTHNHRPATAHTPKTAAKATADTEMRRRAAARGARRRDARARAAYSSRRRGRWLHSARRGARHAAVGRDRDRRERGGGAGRSTRREESFGSG